MKTIHNFKDVAKYFGVDEPDEARISRAIYKGTNCGAWLKFEHTRKQTVKQYYHALLNPHPNGTITLQSVKAGGQWDKDPREWMGMSLMNKIPAGMEIRQFLSMNMDDLSDDKIYDITWEEITTYAKAPKGTYIWHKPTCVISFAIDHTFDATAHGITVGTIVEGADACPEPVTLYFPFPSQALADAIQGLEDEASEIWEEWNNG